MIAALVIYCIIFILYAILCEIGNFTITGLTSDRFIIFCGAAIVSVILYTTYSVFSNGSASHVGSVYAAIVGASLMTLLAGVNVVFNVISDRKYLNQ